MRQKRPSPAAAAMVAGGTIIAKQNAGPKDRRAVLERKVLLAVLLDAGGAQPSKAMLVDRELPAQKFVDRQRVTITGLVEGQEAAADGCDHFRLTPDHPPLGGRWRQIGYR
jgi:hypothetical protein